MKLIIYTFVCGRQKEFSSHDYQSTHRHSNREGSATKLWFQENETISFLINQEIAEHEKGRKTIHPPEARWSQSFSGQWKASMGSLCQTIPLKSLQMPPSCQSRAWLSRSWERAQPGDNVEGSEVKQQKVPDRKRWRGTCPADCRDITQTARNIKWLHFA